MKVPISMLSIFPDHGYILATIKEVLLDSSELDANSPSFDCDALLDAEVKSRGSSSVSRSKKSRPGTPGLDSISFGRRASVSIPMPTISELPR
jgi:hypothetical protein